MNILNHILIYTVDIDAMVLFFEHSLNLKKGYRPPFNFAGAWLYNGDEPIIHLSERNTPNKGVSDYLDSKNSTSESGTGIIDHIAFSGSNYLELIKRLKFHKIKYFERSVPATGEEQVFVEGPEGLRIEIQFSSR